MTVTHWLYPINPKSGYVLRDPVTRKETTVSPDNLLAQIEKYPDRGDPWVLTTGYRLMRRDDVVWIYAAGIQEVRAVARVHEVYFNDDDNYWYALLSWNLLATRTLVRHPISRATFGGQRVQSVSRADRRANPVLEAWLSARSLGVTPDDGTTDPASVEDARNRVLAAIVRRQGQPAFRARLLTHYQGRCAVTAEQAEEVLEAAHIDPYMGPNSNTPNKGLLLRADLHTLFDKHLIAVAPDGSLVVSDRLTGTSYAAMAGHKLFRPPSPRARPKSARLALHRRSLVGNPLPARVARASRSKK